MDDNKRYGSRFEKNSTEQKPKREWDVEPTASGSALAASIAEALLKSGAFGRRINDRGNSYLTTGMCYFKPMPFEFVDGSGTKLVCQLGGQVCVNLTKMQAATAAQAATVESAQTAVARLSPEDRKALLEKLLNEEPS